MIDESKDFDGCDTFAVGMKISTNAIFSVATSVSYNAHRVWLCFERTRELMLCQRSISIWDETTEQKIVEGKRNRGIFVSTQTVISRFDITFPK